MTKVIQLGDPRLKQHKASRLDYYRGRASEALQRELDASPDADLIEGLAETAWRLETGGYPDIFKPSDLAATKKALEELQGEGRKLSRFVESFINDLNSASPDIRYEITHALTARGIDEKTVNVVFEAIADAGDSIAKTKVPPSIAEAVTQGRNPDSEHAWVLTAWQFLKSHLSMKAAGRVCSFVFFGDGARADSLYQTIRNASR